MDLVKIGDYFKVSSKRDWKTAQSLFEIRRFDSCLFFCHLALEKALKYLVTIKTKNFPPHSHDLLRLTKLAKLEVDKHQRDNLIEITQFNISGRYDNQKMDFYKRCTQAYAREYLATTKELLKWLRKNYPKK